jgi:hypothetical protein
MSRRHSIELTVAGIGDTPLRLASDSATPMPATDRQRRRFDFAGLARRDFFAADLFAADRFVPDLFAADLFAPAFFRADFFAADFFAVVFFAVDFFAVDFLAADFFAAGLVAAFFAVDDGVPATIRGSASNMAKAAPCGSLSMAICPPGTGIGPRSSLAPPRVADSMACFASLTPTYTSQNGGTPAISDVRL